MCVFFFKQKTAYEIKECDWSSDVCSSDLETIEDAARVAPKNAWYQLYAARDAKVSDDLIRRTADAGLSTLVLTVDVPVHSKRERNQRNGYANIRGNWLRAALSLKPALLAEAMTHPGWVWEYISNGGTPPLGNWLPYLPNGASAEETVKFNRSQVPAHAQTWKELEHYRKLFNGNLVVKGIMSPADAIRCAEVGCDGIIVSNHGARELDQAAASLER